MQRLFFVVAMPFFWCFADRTSRPAVDATIQEDASEQTSSESMSAEPLDPDDITFAPTGDEDTGTQPDTSAPSSGERDAALAADAGVAQDSDGGSASSQPHEATDVGSGVVGEPHCAASGTTDSWGPPLRNKFDQVKAACDQELERWLCGEFRLRFDMQGCLSRFEIVWGSEAEFAVPFEECLVRRLRGSCDPCAAGTSVRATVSCTLQ